MQGVPISLYSGSSVLLLVYSPLRWADTAQAFVGCGVITAGWLVSVFTDTSGVDEVVGGGLVLVLCAVLGVTLRYRALVLTQRFEQVRSRERESLARELHDTVAHHVSAIAVQAQAGRFLISSHNFHGTAEALCLIEQEASSTLTEMRAADALSAACRALKGRFDETDRTLRTHTPPDAMRPAEAMVAVCPVGVVGGVRRPHDLRPASGAPRNDRPSGDR